MGRLEAELARAAGEIEEKEMQLQQAITDAAEMVMVEVGKANSQASEAEKELQEKSCRSTPEEPSLQTWLKHHPWCHTSSCHHQDLETVGSNSKCIAGMRYYNIFSLW